MTSSALLFERDHLAANRRLVISRAAAVTLAGLTPVPFLDEWLVAAILRRAVAKLGDARHVDLSEEATRALAEGRVAPPGWRTVLSAALIPRIVARIWRTALWAITIYRRAEGTGRTFGLLTLVDHYFARVHTGGELDVARARDVRAAIDRALAGKAGSAVRHFVGRAVIGTGKALVRAPFELADALVGGLLARRRRAAGEEEAEEIVESTVEGRAAEPGSFLGKLTRAIDTQVGAVGKGYVADLVTAFEAELAAPPERKA